MKKSVKAALLSALVYPGAGHFIVNKRPQGIAIMFTFSVTLYFLFSELAEKTEAIMRKVRVGDMPLDINAISNALNQSLINDGSVDDINTKTLILISVWVIALIDAYRIGKKQSDSE